MGEPPTPGQTIGPFFGYALPYPGDRQLVPAGSPAAVLLHGRVLDGAGAPVPDALLEIGQADPSGALTGRAGSLCRDGHTFTGWGRSATDRAGEYRFSTVLPGPAVPGRPPFLAMVVFARGLLDRLFTRVYLPGYEQQWPADPLLASLPAERRATLIATADATGLAFDVRLQGAGETVFLDFGGQAPPAG
ncbi:MAG: protocatechuate 3,4-dioxygenase subunit alpha [Jatrophihabitantaceae bacterium]